MNFIELKSGQSLENVKIEVFKQDKKSLKHIYLIAGVHGDEVEGVFVLKNIFHWLKETNEVDLPLVVIPVLNVDGFRVSSRGNSHGVDLNRNLPADNWINQCEKAKYNPGQSPLSEPENIFLVRLMEKYAPGIIISIHSWKPMLNYNGDCLDVAEYLHQFNHYEVVDSVGYETPGSLGEYAPKHYNAPVLTFEMPRISDQLSLKEIWAENEEGMKSLLKSNVLKRFI
ncbi:MAG: hypothetical protein A2202_05665 [Bdellovibrionales bacterium RIFOXYA1_FULL_36_14]|nr:MAG: hypothetical protein A2202_05665 [Bdellovibrionales bacterium RIFOXYA1_FULL_36_14]